MKTKRQHARLPMRNISGEQLNAISGGGLKRELSKAREFITDAAVTAMALGFMLVTGQVIIDKFHQ